jgi:hypothetical protein
MSRGPTTFRQRDVAAAIKAAKAAGCIVARVEVGRDGRVILVLATGDKPSTEPGTGSGNEWDDILR